ncbi:MAG: excinuclease ABC subunit UvrA [Chthoniobacterales bacterium]|nr:excinuclease ABC subunit UvrA [Chthoniobacterales bacterium]
MPSFDPSSIRVKGARQHNLKNIDVVIPRNRLVVLTGPSGSGKSSLAFDTLYAEGQRKYVESLSAYARQFLDRLQRPDVDFVEGLSPAIAIEQRTAAAGPRSTIATTTEIHDYLRILYAALGVPHDPETGEVVRRQTPQEITDAILAFPEGSRLLVLAPVVRNQAGEFRDIIEKLRREGFVRARIDGEVTELGTDTRIKLDKKRRHSIDAVVDRLVLKPGLRQRLTDSVETALRMGNGRMEVSIQAPSEQGFSDHPFSTAFSNPRTGFTLPKLTPQHFSFNSHLGACPACHGLGTEPYFDPDLVLDPEKSLNDGAIVAWRKGTPKMQAHYAALTDALAADAKVPHGVPLEKLPESFRELLLHGTGERSLDLHFGTGAKRQTITKPFEGLLAQLEHLLAHAKGESLRQRLKALMNRRPCARCRGARLRPEILAVTLATTDGQEFDIRSLGDLTIHRALEVISGLRLRGNEEAIAGEVIAEIARRLSFLEEVGLGYLTLNRESGTLSGGEAQRIRLATQIGSGLAGVLYVLDEPSIGLHQRDNDRLIATLKRLRDLGNSVLVVEHDHDTIAAADHIIDIGPGAGPMGGRIVAQGTIDEISTAPQSLTGRYLSGQLRIRVPAKRNQPLTPRALVSGSSDGWLSVTGARENNLQNVDAHFPLGCFVCVTGVSGSGKSTLVNDILRASLARDLYRAKERPGEHTAILGAGQIHRLVVVDQAPIGRTPRSNPATYTGAFGPVRELFAQVPASRVRGYQSGRFSFNVKGGRCEHCQGDGMLKIEMHFLADVFVACEACQGRRYNRETLEITYKGKNIADVLDMTVDEALSFFRAVPTVADKLVTMQEVGLGYLTLGQSASTLSGGEAQRIKLSTELSKRGGSKTLYLLDEPTTGLHVSDVDTLLQVLMKLRNAGNTLIVIEHNMDVIKCADWIVDLGPGGGTNGGRIVAEGTPEAVSRNEASETGRYLRRILGT